MAPGHLHPEVLPDPRHRDHRHGHLPLHLLRDAGQLQLRGLLQGRRHPHGLGAAHRGPGPRRRPPLGDGARRRRRGRADLDRRGRHPPRAGPAHGRRGQLLGHGRDRPLRPRLGDLHGPRRRPTATTAVPSTAAATASSKSGTSSSCSSTATLRASSPTCRARTSTPAPASSGTCPSSRVSTQCSTPTCSLPLIDTAASILGTGYGVDPATDVALRVLADHGRAFSMLVADGVLPANEGRGYVLRRVVRRAVLAARRAGVDKPISPALVQAATEVLGEAYPALRAQQDLIVNVVAREEAGFDRTLRSGLSRLEEAFATGTKVLEGDVAFTLHDTHGFPVELTEELARDAGVEVDRAGFDAAMAAQRERARAAAKSSRAGDEAVYRALLEAEGTDGVRRPGPGELRGAGADRRRPRGSRPRRTAPATWPSATTARRRRPHRRDLSGPHALLRRERRPGGGHGHHRHRVRHRRGRGHRARRAGPGGAPGAGER